MRVATRLGLIFGAGSLAAVISVGGLGWLLASDEVIAAVDRQLTERAAQLEALAEINSSVSPPAGTSQEPPVEILQVAPGLELYAADGELLIGDVGLLDAASVREIIQDPDTPRPAAADGQSSLAEAPIREIELDGRSFRLLVADVSEATAAADTRIAVVVLNQDVTAQRQALARLRTRIVAAGAAAIVVLGIAGWIVGRRQARPLARLNEATAALALPETRTVPIDLDRDDEIGELASSFNQLASALAIAREQQQRLVADASHELRTPLASLRTRIEFLATTDVDSQRRNELLQVAIADLEELSTLVAELVDLAADVRGPDAQPELTSLDELTADVVARAATLHGRSISFDADHTRAVVRPTMVRRALANLIDNAVKYSPPDTPIEVSLRRGAFEVSDSGPGIAPADRAHVFDRFYRSPEARGRPGTGLGLAIVEHVATVHDGHVWAGSSPSGGARVGFSVTITDAATSASAQPALS